MKIARLIGLMFLIVVIVSLAAIWFMPSLQDFMAANTMWNGINNFASKYHARLIDSDADLAGTKGHSVLVLIPYLDISSSDLARVKSFVDDGGTLLLMDDFGYGNRVLAYLGIEARFAGLDLLDPLFNYKNQYLPRIMDFTPDITGDGVKSICLNHATSLENVSRSNAIAWSARTSFLDINGNGTFDPGEPKGPLTVAAVYHSGGGSIDLVSDPSLIINSMAGSNDNAAFLRYLINVNGPPDSVIFDRSHLAKSPLDTSKINLTAVKTAVSNPYALIGLVAAIFAIMTWYTYKRGFICG